MTGRVVFVGAGPGSPDLITLRGWRALRDADVVLYDSLVDPGLLDETDAERLFVGKRCGRHALAQESISALLAAHALGGLQVVRLKGGDPSVLGRVGEEALHLAALGIPFEIVPGVSSAVAAPAYAGIPVTHRGVADSFCVVSAHRRGDEADFSIPPFHPRTTLILLMAARTWSLWLPQLLRQGYPAATPIALISAATTPEQQVVRLTLGEIAGDPRVAALPSPTMAVVGDVVRLADSLAWFAAAPTERARPARLLRIGA